MCNCGKNKNIAGVKPSFNKAGNDSEHKINVKNSVVSNLVEAATNNPQPFRWFRDGISGIIKCFTNQTIYSDSEIVKNRDVCRNCEHCTKYDNKLTNKSQCMAPDPTKNNAPCGCFVVCKTQTGECPLNKWTHLTINNRKVSNDKTYHDHNTEIDI